MAIANILRRLFTFTSARTEALQVDVAQLQATVAGLESYVRYSARIATRENAALTECLNQRVANEVRSLRADLEASVEQQIDLIDQWVGLCEQAGVLEFIEELDGYEFYCAVPASVRCAHALEEFLSHQAILDQRSTKKTPARGGKKRAS